MDKEYLTSEEVSKYFGVRPTTIKAWRRKGILHPIYVTGGTMVYDKREILEYIERMKGKKHPLAGRIIKRKREK